MEIRKNIFGKYDIRGEYEKDITNEYAYLIGKAFACIAKDIIIVGHDLRPSSNALNANLIKGIVESGLKVIDLGIVTTPMLYYAREFFNVPYAIMITASHCDNSYNGFKLCDEEGSMYEDKISNIYEIITRGEFKEGTGTIEPYDIFEDYKSLMLKKIKIENPNLNLLVSCNNDATKNYYPEIIKDWGFNIYSDDNEKEISFDENIERLEKKVIEINADLGVLFDTDGDRLHIIDEKGKLVNNDSLMYVFYKSIEKTCKNKLAAFDVKCSRTLKEALESLGFKTMFNTTGYPFLKKCVKDYNLDFAGEFSGHFCFNDDFYGYDDALYALGRLLKILTENNVKLSELVPDFKDYVASKETYIEIDSNKIDLVINKIRNYAKVKNYKLIELDGVRIEYPDGFALIRKSNTTNTIITRFEGKTLELMEAHRLEIMYLINEEL